MPFRHWSLRALGDTPVGIAAAYKSLELLRLFERYGCDFREFEGAWIPETANDKEVCRFLTDRGSRISHDLFDLV
jgi:hypothetical protein